MTRNIRSEWDGLQLLPPSVIACHLHKLPATFNYCLPHSVIACHLQLLPATFRNCLPPSVIACHIQSLPATFSYCHLQLYSGTCSLTLLHLCHSQTNKQTNKHHTVSSNIVIRSAHTQKHTFWVKLSYRHVGY
jgi:hypothetical protein